MTRAPGRLDVMGGIADYSGSLVLQLPLAQACHVAVQTHPLPLQRVWRHMQSRHVRIVPQRLHSIASSRSCMHVSLSFWACTSLCSFRVCIGESLSMKPALPLCTFCSHYLSVEPSAICSPHDCRCLQPKRTTMHVLQEAAGGPKAALRVVSLHADLTNRGPTFDMDLAELERDGDPIPYEEARQYFKRDPAHRREHPSSGFWFVLCENMDERLVNGSRTS